MKRLVVFLFLLRNGKAIRYAWEGSSMLVNIAWFYGIELTWEKLFQSLKGH